MLGDNVLDLLQRPNDPTNRGVILLLIGLGVILLAGWRIKRLERMLEVARENASHLRGENARLQSQADSMAAQMRAALAAPPPPQPLIEEHHHFHAPPAVAHRRREEIGHRGLPQLPDGRKRGEP
jgi:hypothetical protein